MKTERTQQILSNIEDKYIRESIDYVKHSQKSSVRFFKRAGTLAASLALIAALSLSSLSIATAAGVMPAYDLLYSLYPEIAEKLTPVNEDCEDNGIRMSVEAIYVHEDSADIYISMQDLTGDRIDETTDLFDSYDIQTTCDQIGGCSLVDFDKESKKATFLISVQQMDGKRIKGRKMTFRVAEFLSGKETLERELTELSLDNIASAQEVQTNVNIRGYAGGDIEDAQQWEKDTIAYLSAQEDHTFSPIDGVTVTAWGFVDGKLHVQAHYEDILDYDNHGYIYLMDSDGAEISCSASVSFWDEAGTGSYEEYIFDLGSEEDLNGYALWGDFVTCRTRTEGNWEVTFPIK